MSIENINKLAETIKSSKNIILLSHVGPDGDTLGSMLALREIILQLDNDKKVDAIIVGKVPDVYKFLPDINLAKLADDKTLYQSYDLAITVDCAAPDRLGDSIDLFRNAKKTANIDHHVTNPEFADINLIEPQSASTGEVVFKLAENLGITLKKEMAINLYTAILTDTGGFKFENTKPATLYTCAKLIEAGADPAYIFKQAYESKPLPMVKLLARAVDEAVLVENNRIAYTFVSRNLLESLGATDDYVDGIAESLRQINTVEVAMVLKETPKGDTKVSFRSNRIDVGEIARFFCGGGHKLAAGCTIQKSLVDTLNEVLPIVKSQINK